MVRHPISQTSGVRIRPLARMERGFVSKSVPGMPGSSFFWLKSLGMDSLKVMIPRDLWGMFMGMFMISIFYS
jgi:hypothetical protein